MSSSAPVVVLPTLAERINREHEACEASYRGALEHAYEAGRLLIEVKTGLEHGEFQPWIEANVSVTYRQARRYMQLAENWDQITEAKVTRESHLPGETELSDLSIRAALKLIPSTSRSQNGNGSAVTGLPAGVQAASYGAPSANEPVPIQLDRGLCPACLNPILQVTFVAEVVEWLPRGECLSCAHTRHAHPGSHVDCSRCGGSGMTGEPRPPGRMLAVDMAWGDEPHARIIGPGTDRRGGEALHALHVCRGNDWAEKLER